MASLQKRGNAFYCQFLYQKRRFTFALGPVSEAEAQAVASKADYILMRIKQGLLDPQGTDIITFIQNDGKVPVVGNSLQRKKNQLCKAYILCSYLLLTLKKISFIS